MKKNAFDCLIGENIRQYREKAALTQAQLAEKVGVGVSFISRIERGEKSMKLQTLRSIANALDTSCDALLRPEISTDPQIATIVNLLKNQSSTYVEGIEAIIRTCNRHFTSDAEPSATLQKDNMGDNNAS